MSLEPPTADTDPVDVDGTAVAPSLTTGAVRAQTGSRLTLTCRASGFPRPSVGWFHNATAITSSGRYSISQSTSTSRVTSTLVVTRTEQDDTGDYNCIANSGGSSGGSGVSVDVTGWSSTAICYMAVNISVFGVGVGVPRINRRPTEEPVYGRDSVTTTIGRIGIDVPSGQQLTVGCAATGNPQPAISWFDKDNSIIEDSGRVQVLGDGSLRVSNFERGDAGAYSCRATNSEGTDQEFIDVREAGKK